MADEFPDPDEEFDLLHQEDYEVLQELGNDEQLEKRQLSQPGPSNISQPAPNGISQTTNKNKPQTNVETLISINSHEVLKNTSNENNRKRTYEELFGDITDLLETDIAIDLEESSIKRIRWDKPEDVIKKILEARQLIHNNDDHISVKTRCNEVKKNSISTRVPPWNFVAITRTYDSQRLYVKMRDEQNDIKQFAKPVSNILSIPYRQLKTQAEEIATKNVLLREQTYDLNDSKSVVNDELWVDKYRPQSYIELLSDETINREFLHWLKLWDKVVFNRDINKLKKKTTAETKLFQYKKKKILNDDNVEEVDSKGYPIKRIALLSGPPGLGKTTLAHIVARHAGYNVIEINASDERSPDAFREILLESTGVKAVIGANPRPNCLIFDEIDGAPAAAIDLLLKFVQGKLKSKAKKAKDESQKVSNGCKRPIVCICNELYTPALRALRTLAVIIPVPEVSSLRLAERLMEIARKEKLNVDFGDLVKIAERSGCDVRSCVGALQYMGNTNLKDNLSLGLKDTRKNVFDSWRSILTVPVLRGGVVTLPERIENILKTIQNGETEKLARGIFHNYPETCDRRLDNVSKSLEWFQFYDLITSLVMHKQIWSLMPYTNYGFIAWHMHLARSNEVKLSYPTVFNEVTQKSVKNTNILTAIQKVYGRDSFTLVTDIAAFLPDLLAPKLRTVPSHLYSSKEKADLVRIINIMFEFGLSYVQEKTSQGGYTYNIDPNIFEIGVLPDCNAHRFLAYAVQQIIAQELEVERLKRANIATGLGAVNSESATDSRNSKSTTDILDKSNSTNNAGTTSKQSKKRTIPLKEIVYRDFFGNIITSEKQTAQKQDKVTNQISPKSHKERSLIQDILTKHGIWYKYKEGCNNAVRRSVCMEKLL